ncbi:DUF2793 domain-containing protein [Polymorphobacter fuscus]|uniref:DUF2793 domain-containing protein n=1 Tax=Sandarakinorhabdus fusca TaxID=1439888 RepID=A0A7C9GPI0_9SPHN|nr:DUF2793 domain-containing protein [Polymorphobacter fuscus]KAB7648190.1 DUF2793 domain-containing protein [Polymorphobacter fuscus]MQT15691.1 DUF2793 domain-containing protein [Polymorphobacter fuscus]NJC08038.1 hypothetical protein [Polymorphobacter fuscus]
MSETMRWGLPLLAAGQAQKEVTHNEAIGAIDRLLHLAVSSRAVSEPPAAPVAGDSYIVGPAATGAWAGEEGRLATFVGGGWTIVGVREGCLAWIADEAILAVFSGDGWLALASAAGPLASGAGQRAFGASAVPLSTGGVADAE